MLNPQEFNDDGPPLRTSEVSEQPKFALSSGRHISAKAHIVIVDDNPGDVFVMEEALREHGVSCEVTVLSTGEEATDLFKRIEQNSAVSCPDLVLLDLNLPKRSGHSVLERIRASFRCPNIPVVIVTSSESESDLAQNRKLGATAYFKKSSNLEMFMELGALVHSLLNGK